MTKSYSISGPSDLLIKLRDDLVRAGLKDDKTWNEECSLPYVYLIVSEFENDGQLLTFFNGGELFGEYDHHRKISSVNYASLLSEIIAAKTGEQSGKAEQLDAISLFRNNSHIESDNLNPVMEQSGFAKIVQPLLDQLRALQSKNVELEGQLERAEQTIRDLKNQIQP